MALQVAPCPRCRGAIVFGERQCRACAQPFDYGARAPELPTPQQVWEALASVGQIPQDPAAAQALAQSIQQTLARFSAPATATTQPTRQAQEPSAPRLAELDTGRFETPAVVQTVDVPGLVDSTLFAAFTPKDVSVSAIPGLEQTAQAKVGDVNVALTADFVPLNAPVGEVRVERIPEIFHSDFLKAPDGVPTQRLDVIESSPSAFADRGRTAARDTARKTADKASGQLGKVVCRCGETHRLPRCPSCGTSHPGLD